MTVSTSTQEALTACNISSTCQANQASVSGSTTVTNGTLVTDSGDDSPGNVHPPVQVTVPINPAPNTSFPGHIHVNGTQDNFRYVFNEQILNPDGSITVNAAHEYLLGPIAVGDLIIGQVVCGVTATLTTTTTLPTTTTTRPTTTTTLPTTTTTTQGPGGTTLKCKVKTNSAGASYLLCRVFTPGPLGIRHVNVVDTVTGVREQSISVPPNPATKTLTFKVDLAGPHRVVITTWAGDRIRYMVASDGTVTQL